MADAHGSDEKAVFDELLHVLEEAIVLYHKDGKPLPPPTSGRDFANKMQNVAYQCASADARRRAPLNTTLVVVRRDS